MSLIFQVFIQQYEWIFHSYLIPFTDNVNGIYLIFREKFEKNQNRTAEAQTCAGESQKSDVIPIEPRSLDIRLGCNYNICTWYVVVYDLFKPFKPYLRTIDFINMYLEN